MFIIERGEEGIRPINNDEAMEILLSNCEDAYGFPPYNDLKEFLYFNNGDRLTCKRAGHYSTGHGGTSIYPDPLQQPGMVVPDPDLRQ